MKAFKREWASQTFISEDRISVIVGIFLLSALFIWRLCM